MESIKYIDNKSKYMKKIKKLKINRLSIIKFNLD